MLLVLSTLFKKLPDSKEDLAQYMNEFQQLFVQRERTGPNAVSEKFKVPLLLFSTGQFSASESSVAVFRTLDNKIFDENNCYI